MTDARFSFEEVTALSPRGDVLLDGIDLQLGAPGLTCLAGPSGSGKSTLLRMCNRLSVPARGCVRLDGTDLTSLDPLTLRRRVGMVFQWPVTFPGTVRDNLLVAAADAPDERLADVLGQVGLGPEYLDRVADDLSGGEAQRMCTGRTLLTDPEIILMDEPTSALDVDARLVIERLAATLVERGLVIVWVTHDLDQAERIADRVVVVVDGRVAADDEAARYLRARSFTPTGEEGEL